MNLLWVIFALCNVHIVYIIAMFPYCISLVTLLPSSDFLLSRLFWFFLCFFVLYIYILWFHILLLLHCFGRAFQYKTAFSSRFFRLFDVEISFKCRPFLFKGLILYRYTAYYYHSKILRRLCVATSWFPILAFPPLAI